MNKMNQQTLFALCAFSAAVGLAGAQQVSSSSRASGASSTSVSASRSGAEVGNSSDATASNQTAVTAPERQRESKETTEAKPKGHSRRSRNEPAESGGHLATGSTVNAVLAKPLDSRKSKPGDPVVATAAQNVKSDSDSHVVIPKGSRLIGHVTEAKAKGKGDADSSLGIVFDRAVLKGGREVPMNSVVQALAAARTSSAAAADDDAFGAAGSGALAGTGAVRGGSGGGLAGGLGSTGVATGAVAGVTGGASGAVGGVAGGAAGSTLGSTANLGGGLQGTLNSASTGVIGLKNLSLSGDAANATEGSVITSPEKSVHLDSGTQMILRVVNP